MHRRFVIAPAICRRLLHSRSNLLHSPVIPIIFFLGLWSRSISIVEASVTFGKCFRMREGGGIRRVVDVRAGKVTFVQYQETEKAGTSAFLSDPVPLADFLQDVEENIQCPKWMF
jgi:hypothetical protein